MLDILDKDGKVVAILMDDGTVVKKAGIHDDIDELIREKLKELNKKRKR